MRHRTPAYWPTRILLGVGIVATAATVGLTLVVAAARRSMFGPPSADLVLFAAPVLAVIGLAWMLRIFRGPRDEPPPWRYRDR